MIQSVSAVFCPFFSHLSSAKHHCELRVPETRNSSGDEIASVNFLYDDNDVHALQNTIDSCINSAMQIGRSWNRFTEFREIMQCNGHYAIQSHSRSPILVPIESSCIAGLLLLSKIPATLGN